MSLQDSELPSALEELARERGVATSHVDGLGVGRTAEPEVVMTVLNAFDDMEALSSPDQAAWRLREYRQGLVDRVLDSVYVVDEGVDAVIPIRPGRRVVGLDCRIEFEFGGESSWFVNTDALTSWPAEAGVRGQTAGLALPAMRIGYHSLIVRAGRRSAAATIIVRPLRGASSRFARDWRAYSVQAPIFALHSKRSWGSGDIADFDEFARLASREHASVVSTLPLLATFGPSDFEASPYRPVSRRFWSDRWIALDRVDDLMRSPTGQHLMNETYSPMMRAAWVRDGVVDGERAFTAKRNVLQAWAATLSDVMQHDDSGLRAYVMDNPDVNDYARFRAAGERFGLDFHQWPSTARSGLLRWNDVDPIVVRYHLLAQWIVDSQMTELSSNLEQRGQTLELDIPVGVHPYGYDVWRSPGQFVNSMSIGAPPDEVGREGQNWGSLPPHPERCRDDAHSQLRAALRFHMRCAGVVRIDHVMGLQRLFWIPDGVTPEKGVYVSMPFKELLAVVAIEAHRLGVDVVGEDLGTVDDEVRTAMQREGLRRTYAAQFAIRTESATLDEVPSGSVASFSTHDTPTFRGWWTGADIDEREHLGLLDATSAEAGRQRRARERQALLTALGRSEDDAPDDILLAVHQYLAKSEAGLVMVQLEDVLGETTAVNLPGTSYERPNWSRLARLSLEELAQDTSLARTLAPLRRQRGFAISGTEGDGVLDAWHEVTRFSAEDLHLFNEGRHFRLYRHLGSHPMVVDGVEGCYFAVWAPNADRVSVIGEFNQWNGARHPLAPRESSGVWEGFIPSVSELTPYKYRVRSRLGGEEFDKTDPYGRYFEVSPATSAKVWSSNHDWGDGDWMRRRSSAPRHEPMSIYEVHLGSWRRVPEEQNRSLTYRELAPELVSYLTEMGFTHVELLPVMEHPFYGSWGYQTTGYFAPTSRMGSPDDFKFLVDQLHQAGIGVLLDWVPSHFPSDSFALARFDGSYLYEHADVRQRVHPDWQSWTFNYGRNEVRSFLISGACYWLDEFHIDGLRLDAVASMLYLDYSRKPGEWVPNHLGGHEDLDAVAFLRQCTSAIEKDFPGVVTIAEESTAWPAVTGPVHEGGLGFTFKWDLGWMHDTLEYLQRDPIYRRHHHGALTFRALYASSEHYVLPLSHDEVVHGKGSLLSKMVGDEWQKRANLRLLFGYQYTVPGKKLVFMGDEFAQTGEWNHDTSLDWHLRAQRGHEAVLQWVRRLNALYREHPALHRDEFAGEGFSWLSCDDAIQSVLIWRREVDGDELVVLANFTPVPRDDYKVAVGMGHTWEVLADSDDVGFGGSGYLASRAIASFAPMPDEEFVRVTLPPLAIVVLGRKA